MVCSSWLHASHYLPLNFAGPKAQPVSGLCKGPQDHPPTMQAQGPLQSQLPRSDNGNQLPLQVSRTLSDDPIIPSETEGEWTQETFISLHVL